MAVKKHTEEDKGRMVRITGKRHEGRIGWVHLNANRFETKIWVILQQVSDNNGTMRPEKAHLIDKDLICYDLAESEPSCYEEALLREHKDIKHDMKTVAKKLAEFDDFEPSDKMMEIFMEMWIVQKRRRQGKRRVPGSRFVLDWDDPNVVEEEDFSVGG